MRRTLLLLLLSFVAALSLHAGPRNRVDSMRKVLRTQNDTSRVLTLIKLSQAYFSIDKDSGLLYAQQLRTLAEKWGNPQRLCDAYVVLGAAFHHVMQLDSAMYYKRKGLAVAEKAGYQKGIGNACNDIGLYEKENGRMDTAMKYILRAIDVREKIRDKKGLGSSYTNYALLLHAQRSYDQALDYYEKAANFFLETGQLENYAVVIDNEAALFDDLQQYEKALALYNRSLVLFDSLDNQRGISQAELNIGVLYRNLGKFSEAEPHLLKSLEIKEAINDKALAICLLDLAQNSRLKGDYKKAETYLARANERAIVAGLKETERDVCLEYSELYAAQHKFELALKFLRLYNQKKDSIFNEEKILALTEMQTKYETVKKEKENSRLKQETQEKALQVEMQNLEIERGKSRMILLYAGLGVLVIILGFAVFAFLLKTKSNRLLTEKNEQISRHNKTLKELNAKLIESEEELTELNRTKDKLFSVISHDISNPVKAIANYNQAILARESDLTRDQTVEALKKINQSVQPLQGFIDNLLHWSLLQRNGAALRPEKFPPWSVASEIVKLYEPYAQQKNVKLLSNIPPGVNVYADKDMFRLVLRNLYSNAIKYSKENGHVKFSAELAGAKIRFTVSDEGEGMTAEKIRAVLDGKQVASERGTYAETGTGMGLSLVSEYLRSAGSDLKIESEVGKGTKISFQLPVG